MRPLLTPEAAAIVESWQARSGGSASALTSEAVVTADRCGLAPGLPTRYASGIGPRLRTARLRLGLSQSAVAAAVGISQARVSQIERGGAASADVVAWVEREEMARATLVGRA